MIATNKKSAEPYQESITSQNAIAALQKKGYLLFDPHLHTSASYDVLPSPGVSPQFLYDLMVKKGHGLVTFTDHDTIDAYSQVSPGNVPLVKGAEIRIRPNKIGNSTKTHTLHINVYDFSNKEFFELEELGKKGEFKEFISYCRNRNLPHMLNHPLWCEFGERIHEQVLADVMQEFSVIEGFNQTRLPQQNLVARKLASHLSIKGIVASSDNHVGMPSGATLVKGNTFSEMWRNIQQGNMYVVPQNNSLDFMIKQGQAWIHLLRTMTPESMSKSKVEFRTGVAFFDKLIEYGTDKAIRKFPRLKAFESYLVDLIFNIRIGTFHLGSHFIDRWYLQRQQTRADFLDARLQSLMNPVKTS